MALSLDAGSKSAGFVDSLSQYSKLHQARRWEGTFGEFLTTVLPANAAALARTSHEYVWNMLQWHGREASGGEISKARELFKRELFGVDEPLARVVDYFKASAPRLGCGTAAAAAARAALGW